MEKKKGLSASGILTILALVLIPLAIGVFLMPGGGGSGDYDHYAGPVLPMTAISGGEHLEVRRNVDFDFSAYAQERANILDTGSAAITDTYELTNTSPETVTVELAYGFEGQFTDPPEQFPQITVDGTVPEMEILPSVDVNGTIHHAHNWETYKNALTQQDFLTGALTPVEVPDIPVTVIRLSEFSYDGPETTEPVFVGAEFPMQEGSAVWVPHFDMTRQEDGMWQVYCREEVELYFVGAAPEDVISLVNIGYNVTENSMVPVKDVKTERRASALADCLWEAAQVYDFWAENSGYPDPGYMTPEQLFESALKMIADPDYRNPSGDVLAMSSVFYDAVTDIRMLYQTFSVTIPAGETVTVEAVFTQEPSTDIAGPREPREGYDLATRLGSGLNFTEQTSSLSNWEAIEIRKQNFGFDLKRNITSVVLDLKVERYYLDVAAK